MLVQLYHDTGKKGRIVVGDGSSATYEPLVDAGIAEMADFSIRDWPFSTLKQFSEGLWPEDVLDPKSKMLPLTPAQVKDTSIYIFEGMSVASNYLMGDKKGGISARAALGEKIAGDSPIQIVDAERDASGNIKKDSGPGYAFGGVTLGGYGVAQRRMLDYMQASKGLPGWVIWTGHERTSEDKVTGQKVVGPEVAGSALSASISRIFNNTLHFATAEKTVKQTDSHTTKSIDVLDTEYRIYVRDHFRPEGGTFTKYKAVTRHPDPTGLLYGKGKEDALPLYFESDKPGQAVIDFYAHVARAQERQKLALRKAA